MKKTAEEDFKEKQALMSDSELIELAKAQVSELAKTGGRSHRMCVPPSIKDTDMLFSELIRRFEFSSQDKWVSVETPPKEHGKLYLCYQPIDAEDFKFIILWFDKMTSKFRGWSDEFENRDEDGDFRSVTHWQELPALPSPPKTK